MLFGVHSKCDVKLAGRKVCHMVSGQGLYRPWRVTGMMVLTSALASSVSLVASSTSRKPGLSAPGFTTTLNSTPAAQTGSACVYETLLG